MLRILALSVVASTLSLAAFGQDAEEAPTNTINGLTGPATSNGFEVDQIGEIDLAGEFPGDAEAANRFMRARKFAVQPGGRIPIHSHENRPAFTLVLEGEIQEHRSDSETPIVRQAGDVTSDTGGVAQWLENVSDEPVMLLVVDMAEDDASATAQ